MIYHIVAMAKNRVIGKDNRLPWHFSEDLKHFKQITLGHTVIMGRHTFESIGRPLPGRENFVLSRSAALRAGVKVFASLEEALAAVKTRDVFIIGGAQVYRESLKRVDGIHLTLIDREFEGDAFYPSIPGRFKERSRRILREDPRLEAIFYVVEKEPTVLKLQA